jgi:hypothetical protein
MESEVGVIVGSGNGSETQTGAGIRLSIAFNIL